MRDELTIRHLIISFAEKDERVRAVILNGSRANPGVVPDSYQDFDIVFIVNRLDSFIADTGWRDFLGEKLIEQLPDDMTFGKQAPQDEPQKSFAYLMQFKDGNRIDLTLFSKQFFHSDFKLDSLTIVWLDKDCLFDENHISNDGDYLIAKPGEKEFLDTCNEFWWVSTYVAKGLLRNEIIYAKEMLETVVRPMFMKMIEWKIGCDYHFSVSFGKAGRYMKKYVAADLYQKVLATYTDANIESNWQSLFIITACFQQLSIDVANQLNFTIHLKEQENTIEYLQKKHNEKPQ